MNKIIRLSKHYKAFVTKLIQEKNWNKGLKVQYYNFWETSFKDYWFTRFLAFHNLLPPKKKIYFFSVFGPVQLIYFFWGIKIYFSGESLKYLYTGKSFERLVKFLNKNVDLFISFTFEDNMPENYFRFPLWVPYLLPVDANFETIKFLVKKYNALENRANTDRTRYTCIISRHDRNGMRTEIVELMNQFGSVTGGGTFMNTTDELKTDFNDVKLDYLRKFKFNICPENRNDPGYVTEKVFESIMAGAIPIYWGNKNPEPEILNENAIIFYNPNNKEEFVNKIEALMLSEEALSDFRKIPPFKENAATHIWAYYVNLKNRLEAITKS